MDCFAVRRKILDGNIGNLAAYCGEILIWMNFLIIRVPRTRNKI
jgi:hypothetical protein